MIPNRIVVLEGKNGDVYYLDVSYIVCIVESSIYTSAQGWEIHCSDKDLERVKQAWYDYLISTSAQ